MLINEIKYLRQLRVCENIVQLHAVYIQKGDCEATVSLVMSYA